MSEWIDVEEGEPSYGKNVLVAVWTTVRIGRLYTDVGWDVDGTERAPVTHWMPLPDPPEAPRW